MMKLISIIKLVIVVFSCTLLLNEYSFGVDIGESNAKQYWYYKIYHKESFKLVNQLSWSAPSGGAEDECCVPGRPLADWLTE